MSRETENSDSVSARRWKLSLERFESAFEFFLALV